MLHRTVFATSLLLAGTLAFSHVACSQANPAKLLAPSRGDVYAGVLGNGSNPDGMSISYNGGVDFNFLRWLAANAEVGIAPVSIYNGTNTFVVTDFLVGPRVFLTLSRYPKFAPYADVLIGGENLNNTRQDHSPPNANGTHFAVSIDGGVELRLIKHLAIRGQAGYLRNSATSNFTSPPSSLSGGRIRGGAFLVYRF